MAARAETLARLAYRFGCSVPEVRAMTQREVNAMGALHDEVDEVRRQQRALAQAQSRKRRV
ncbi:MAG: hypothetical protein U0667_18415 [Chloroflexota bacterium]